MVVSVTTIAMLLSCNMLSGLQLILLFSEIFTWNLVITFGKLSYFSFLCVVHFMDIDRLCSEVIISMLFSSKKVWRIGDFFSRR